MLTRDCKCKLLTDKLLETSGIKLKFGLENVYEKPKRQATKAVVSSPYGGPPNERQGEQTTTAASESQ